MYCPRPGRGNVVPINGDTGFRSVLAVFRVAWIVAVAAAVLVSTSQRAIAFAPESVESVMKMTQQATLCAEENLENSGTLCRETLKNLFASEVSGKIAGAATEGAMKIAGKIAEKMGANVTRAALRAAPRVIGTTGSIMASWDFGTFVGDKVWDRWVEPEMKAYYREKDRQQNETLKWQTDLLRSNKSVAKKYSRILAERGRSEAEAYLASASSVLGGNGTKESGLSQPGQREGSERQGSTDRSEIGMPSPPEDDAALPRDDGVSGSGKQDDLGPGRDPPESTEHSVSSRGLTMLEEMADEYGTPEFADGSGATTRSSIWDDIDGAMNPDTATGSPSEFDTKSGPPDTEGGPGGGASNPPGDPGTSDSTNGDTVSPDERRGFPELEPQLLSMVPAEYRRQIESGQVCYSPKCADISIALVRALDEIEGRPKKGMCTNAARIWEIQVLMAQSDERCLSRVRGNARLESCFLANVEATRKVIPQSEEAANSLGCGTDHLNPRLCQGSSGRCVYRAP